MIWASRRASCSVNSRSASEKASGRVLWCRFSTPRTRPSWISGTHSADSTSRRSRTMRKLWRSALPRRRRGRASCDHAPGDALADRHADLRPELGLDSHGHAHAQLAGLWIEQHQRAALGAGHADRDLEHAAEELVGVDREIVGLDDLVERLQQLRLVVGGRRAVAPEQPRDQGRDDLDAARRDLGEAVREVAVVPGVDHGEEPRIVHQGVGVGLHPPPQRLGDLRGERAQTLAQGGGIRVEDRRDLDRRVGQQEGDQLERFLGRSVDADPLPHQPGSSSTSDVEPQGEHEARGAALRVAEHEGHAHAAVARARRLADGDDAEVGAQPRARRPLDLTGDLGPGGRVEQRLGLPASRRRAPAPRGARAPRGSRPPCARARREVLLGGRGLRLGRCREVLLGEPRGSGSGGATGAAPARLGAAPDARLCSRRLRITRFEIVESVWSTPGALAWPPPRRRRRRPASSLRCSSSRA